jgi:D-xylose transport system ATP-binding protein
VIELRDIGKEFPGVRALGGVSLSIERGEVLGLVGENGAGKSTLIKILGGVYAAGEFEGEIVVEGRARAFRSTRDARAAGIAVVHQELSLVPEMSVTDNLLLGKEIVRWGGVVDGAASEARARAILARTAGEIAESIDVREPAGRLGVGMQQVIEIARALGDEREGEVAALVVLDEPTAALSEAEARQLFEVVRQRREGGASFVFISHHLDEVMAVCDRVAVLRDGKLVAVRGVAEVNKEEIVELMTGAEAAGEGEGEEKGQGQGHGQGQGSEVLEVVGLRVKKGDRWVVDGLSLKVGAGEVVALAGAMGAGRTATMSALFGLVDGEVEGEVKVDGKRVTIDEPRDAIAAGLALVPEDRKGAGLVLGMSVVENMALPAKTGWVVDGARMEKVASQRVKELRIKVPGLGAEVATLSGGNQQKVVIGKWLERAPRVLLLDEPTRGVDVGAKAEIYRLIEELTAKGHAVLLASSDLPEIVRLADRVIVMRDGTCVGELSGDAISGLAIMKLAMGSHS